MGNAGTYTLERLIGSGGMGSVFRARESGGELFAIKLLHREKVTNKEWLARFIREARVANTIEHPGVVRIHDEGMAEDGSPFIVMDLLEGYSLKRRIKAAGGLLMEAEVVALALELLDVLAAAHAVDVVHRDLKPDNLFLTTDHRLKLLDFGIARELGSNEDLSMTGQAFGTLPFMPPEQARGLHSQIDGRTDLWAVGALMFTLLTNEYVHGRRDRPVLALQKRAVTERARPIRSVAPDVSQALASVIDRALEFERFDRWPDASSMRAALAAVATTEVAEPTTSTSLPTLPSSEVVPIPHDDTPEPPVDDVVTLATIPKAPPAPDRAPSAGAARSRRGAALGLIAIVAACSILVFVLSRRADPAGAGALPVGTAAPVSPPEDAGIPSPPSPSIVSSATSLAERPLASTPSRPPKRPPPSVRRDPAAQRCDPPYYVTPNGIREYKLGCL